MGAVATSLLGHLCTAVKQSQKVRRAALEVQQGGRSPLPAGCRALSLVWGQRPHQLCQFSRSVGSDSL